jgi:hypothetical protein
MPNKNLLHYVGNEIRKKSLANFKTCLISCSVLCSEEYGKYFYDSLQQGIQTFLGGQRAPTLLRAGRAQSKLVIYLR